MAVAGHCWCLVKRLGEGRGDGLEWSPGNGHVHTAALGPLRGRGPATGRCAAERRLVTARGRPPRRVDVAATRGVGLSLALSETLFFVGIDWAAAEHAVCVMNEVGRIVAEFTIKHLADGIAQLVRRLAKYGDPELVPIAIERPNGRLVDLLLEAGHAVVPVSPNAIKTWREGEVLSGAKSDAGDAAVIAEYLRLRQHRLQVVTSYSSQTKAVRTVVRTRDDLVEMRVTVVNQLSALLEAHWPGAKVLFADLESPISLEFLTRYPRWSPPPTSVKGGWPRSAPSTPTRAGGRPPSCWRGCKQRRRERWTRHSRLCSATPCLRWSPCSRP
jgi:hypothetical protein